MARRGPPRQDLLPGPGGAGRGAARDAGPGTAEPADRARARPGHAAHTRAPGSALAAAPGELIDALRLSARQPESAASVASQHHTLDRFRAPAPETVMTGGELAQVSVPALFVWGRDDPYLPPAAAQPWVAKVPGGVLREVPGGHAPWLDDPAGCGPPVTDFLRTH